MAKKYPKSALDEQKYYGNEEMVVAWNRGEDEVSMRAVSSAYNEFTGISRAYRFDNFRDIQTNVSGRPGFTRKDYEYFRHDERLPVKHPHVILACDDVYRKVGLVRNIFDLMGNFATQGVRLSHPNPKIQLFFRNWFRKVNGKQISERFANYLVRHANVVVKKHYSKISLSVKKKMLTSIAAEDEDMVFELKKHPKRRIPMKFTFMHPATIDVVGGALASFVGNPQYYVKIPDNLKNIINSPKDAAERALVEKLPPEIKQAAKSNKGYILPEDKVSIYFYKKDDWKPWADPMVYAILDDVYMLEKLRLADLAALDGAISNIRIFKIGSFEHNIMPTRAAAAKLSAILESNVGGGTMDLVWGPDIELIESNTNVHQFLGEAKYKPHLNSIYAGLGVPPTLTGSMGSIGGTTNNFISLQTLIQNLQYIRDILTQFWEEQIDIVQQAMGFRLPAKVEFDYPSLDDQVAEKKILLDMADRNLISEELLQTIFKHDPDLEKTRIKREHKERSKEKYVPKAGPFHDPQFKDSLLKIALQNKMIGPKQAGVPFDDTEEEKPSTYMKEAEPPKPAQSPPAKKVNKDNTGRPKNSKDKTQRKSPRFTPKNKAVLEIWARSVYEEMSEYIKPHALKMFGKANLRQLTSKEAEQLEKLKFGVLSNLEPLSVVDENTIKDLISKKPNYDLYASYSKCIKEVRSDLNRELTLDEEKMVQSFVYASYYGED